MSNYKSNLKIGMYIVHLSQKRADMLKSPFCRGLFKNYISITDFLGWS